MNANHMHIILMEWFIKKSNNNMTNILKTTKQIHDTIDKINQKYGLEIDIKSGSKYTTEWTITSNTIKQILNALKDMLGENPNIKRRKDGFSGAYHNPQGFFMAEIVHDDNGEVDELNFAFLARDLCYKWLDGLNPLFDSEPEKVLEELLEVLENLIK